MSEDQIRTQPIVRWRGGQAEMGRDALVVEEPLEIRLAGESLAVTMRTPGHDVELAAGFALTEGVVEEPEELESVRPCSDAVWGNIVDLVLCGDAARTASPRAGRARREMFLSSSCGLCGKESIDRVRQRVSPLEDSWTIAQAVLEDLPAQMLQEQGAFAQTGGLHAAALFSRHGDLRILREDVGRHNAVDKVIGHELLLGRVPAAEQVLLVSGRLSFEIVQKAARAGMAMLCAVSAPSSLAVGLADELGMTLVGFLREGRMNVYTDRFGRIISTLR